MNRQALLWFVGALILIAMAGPAPQVATTLVVLIIVLVLLKNWQTYATYLGGGNQ